MFPNVVFFLIFLLIMESILKSIKEKNKIEEKKGRRSQRPVEKQTIKPSKQVTISNKRKETPRLEKSRSLEMKPSEEDFLEDIYTIKDEIKKEDLTNRKNPLKPKKEDILKGIIYSEILSKPKSLRR